MQGRVARVTLMVFLIASGITAAYFLWTVEQRSNASVTAQADVSARLSHMSETIAGIGTAQQGYVAPGQLDEPWFEQTSTLLDQLSIDTEQASSSLRSPEAAEAMQALADSTDALIAADARMRQNLGLGQDLMAADVIFSDGHNIVNAMITRLRELQTAERASHLAELAALTRQRWITFLATLLVWVTGLLALVKIPAAMSTPATVRQPAEASLSVSVEPPAEPGSLIAQGAPLDLALVAELCTDLSRVTDTATLPDLLGRAAGILDASGVILWVGAGEQLFPVTGHGYRQDVMARLPPIARDEENATADAWRAGRLTVVSASGPADSGAIVAPLLGLHGCLGVLAAEVRHGAEVNPTTRALATMIAAQLATVVPAWPAASLTQPAGATPGVEPPPTHGKATLEVRSA